MSTDHPKPSPCIDICHLNDATGLCEGCWRSIDEIARWSSLDEPGRRAIIVVIEGRRRRSALQGE